MSGLSLFAGANTAKGFFSYYNYLARDDSRRVFILKGGPGTGKSTLIKKIAQELENDYSVNRFHCSADLNSLDGIHIPQLDISILDGTAPHTIDPRLPGAVQQIIDLGTCWNAEALVANRGTIQELTNAISKQYKLAYKWLAMAAQQADLIQTTERQQFTYKQTASTTKAIIELLPGSAAGLEWQAFASAITGNGLINFLTEVQQSTPVRILLEGGNRSFNDKVLQNVRLALLARGIPATYLYCGLMPNHLEHIVIPGVFGLYSQHKPHVVTAEGKVFGPREPIESALEAQLFETIQYAVEILGQAKSLHMELEKIYVPLVDFTCVGEKQRAILSQIDTIKTRG